MSVDMEKAISYFASKVGKIKYSMYGSRNFSDGTCDCSGAVYTSMIQGGANKLSYIPSTETMHQWLLNNGFKLIAENKGWQMKRGDVVIWGKKGYSAGSGGHTGICIDGQNWLECTAYNNLGVTQQNHDKRLEMNGFPYWYVYRQESAPQPQPQPQQGKPHPKAEGSVDQFEKVGNKIVCDGWTYLPQISGYNFVILQDRKGVEIARGISKGIVRKDVNKAMNVPSTYAFGTHVEFDAKLVKGKEVRAIFRRTQDKKGNVKQPTFDVFSSYKKF